MASGYNPEPVFAVFVDLVINNFSIRQNPFPVHEQDALIYKQNFTVGRLSQKEPISVLQRPCIGSFCILSLSNYGRIFLYHRKNFYPRTSSHWSMFPKCTACRLSTSTSCGKLFLMIMTPFSLSCFSPPPAMPPMVLSSVKTVPSL